MEYGYEFEYVFPEIMEDAASGVFMGAAGVFVGVLLLFWLLAMAFSVISYVLGAVGMYRIAKRRGIHHAWLAWIPVGNAWLLGSISDHYQYVVKQKTTKRRKVLLILNIIVLAMSGIFGTGVGFLAATEIMAGETSGPILLIALMFISYLAVFGLAIAISVISYVAYFDLFRSCKPKNDVLFLVLGILFSVTLPFFVFACSNADEGMPARRSPQEPAQIPGEPQEEETYSEEEIPVVEAELVEAELVEDSE